MHAAATSGCGSSSSSSATKRSSAASPAAAVPQLSAKRSNAPGGLVGRDKAIVHRRRLQRVERHKAWRRRCSAAAHAQRGVRVVILSAARSKRSRRQHPSVCASDAACAQCKRACVRATHLASASSAPSAAAHAAAAAGVRCACGGAPPGACWSTRASLLGRREREERRSLVSAQLAHPRICCAKN